MGEIISKLKEIYEDSMIVMREIISKLKEKEVRSKLFKGFIKYMKLEPIVPHYLRCSSCDKIMDKFWYRCLTCFSYRVCELCYEQKVCCVGWVIHDHWHPLQLVFRNQVRFPEGESRFIAPFVKIYTCPYCSKTGFSYYTIQDHLKDEHRGNVESVNCPICFSISDHADFSTLYNDLLEHVVTQHYLGKRYVKPIFH